MQSLLNISVFLKNTFSTETYLMGVTDLARVRARSSPCAICGGKVALGQVFLRVLRFSLVSITSPCFSTHISLGDEQRTCWWPQFKNIILPHRHEQND
jgi:hypothetical protein